MAQNQEKRINTRRNRWPDGAENARMEAIATAERIKELIHRAEELILQGQTEQALRLLATVWDKANGLSAMMRQVKDGKWRE